MPEILFDDSDSDNNGFDYTETEYDLVANGATDYVIVTTSSKAGYELKYFFEIATGATIDVITNSSFSGSYSSEAKYISLGSTKLVTQAEIEYDQSLIGEDGVRILTEGKSIFILGDNTDNLLNGVYEFLEIEFNYDFYYQDTFDIDKGVTEVKLKNYDITDISDISPKRPTAAWFSDTLTYEIDGTTYEITQGERYRMTDADTSLFYVPGGRTNHNAFEILGSPKETSNPKWYKHSSDNPTVDEVYYSGQICFTAHGDSEQLGLMLDKVAETFANTINNATYKKKFIAFGVEDGDSFCRCSACQANVDLYGCDSASAIIFMNYLAYEVEQLITVEDRKDVKYIFDAYNHFLTAPVNFNEQTGKYELKDGLELHEDVGVFVALKDKLYRPTDDAGQYGQGVDFYNSISTDRNQEQTVERIKSWADICDTILLWTYDVNSFIPDIKNDYFDDDYYKTLASFDLDYLFHEGPYGTGAATSFNILKGYLTSKLTWDSSVDISVLFNKYFNAMYGDGSADMKAYYELLKAHSEDFRVNNRASCENAYVDTSYFSLDDLKAWYNLCEYATIAVGSDERLIKNINIERVLIDYLLLELYSADEFTVNNLADIQARLESVSAFAPSMRVVDPTTKNERKNIQLSEYVATKFTQA